MEQGPLQASVAAIRAAGASLVSITPEIRCEIRTLAIDGHPFNAIFDNVALQQRSYPVLVDQGNKVARQYGLVHGFPPELMALYKQFGIDLEVQNGDNSWTLPLPATYVIDQDARIRHTDVHVDYRTRAEPSQIIEVVRRLQSQTKT
jgi:alkyl hydroperoxide reductase subunit AhpC